MARYDVGSGLSGAASGAAIGTYFGPGVGTAIGGIAGGLLGLLGSKRKKPKNSDFKPNKISTLDPEQERLYSDYVSSLRGSGPFSNLYNFDTQGYNQLFDQSVARPAYRGFQENIIPSITGQFRSNNLMNSSYAGQALSRAGRDVQESLDAQRASNIFAGQQNAQANRQNAINNILGMQTFAVQRPEQQAPSGIDQILGSLAPAAGQWFADYLRTSRAATPPPAAAPSVPNPVG